MSSQKPSIPKGTRDFGPEEVTKRKYILNTIEQVFIKYGFMPIETPTMEKVETLLGKYGDEGDRLIFKIFPRGEKLKPFFNKVAEIVKYNVEDDKGRAIEYLDSTIIDELSQKLAKEITEEAMRYDLTVPFARYVVMHQNEITFPFKRYQMQPVWRADRPQKGRYREFWQCDADVVGSDSLLNELDLIQIYDEAFIKLGIKRYELRINNRKILAGIAEVVKSIEYMNSIAVAIDKLDKIGEEGVRKELAEQSFSNDELNKLFEIITIKGENNQLLLSLKEKLHTSQEGTKGIEELIFVVEQLQQLNPSIHLKIDFSLARGLSYYTGCILEVSSLDGSLTSSIAGGGRYDNLTGIFGLPNISGVGISFGLDRIYDVMEELKLFPPTLNQSTTQLLFCCFDDNAITYTLPLLKELRDAGIASEIYPQATKMKKQLGYANDKKIPFACIIGDNEMQSGKLVVKDLHAGTQQELTLAEIINQFRR